MFSGNRFNTFCLVTHHVGNSIHTFCQNMKVENVPCWTPPLPQKWQIPLYFLIFLTLPFIFPLFFILISRFFCSKKSVENSGPRSGRLQEAEIKIQLHPQLRNTFPCHHHHHHNQLCLRPTKTTRMERHFMTTWTWSRRRLIFVLLKPGRRFHSGK